MAANQENEKDSRANFSISFPNAPKDAKNRKEFFEKTISLIDSNISDFSMFNYNIGKKKKEIQLEHVDMVITISFYKRSSIRFIINNPEDNIEMANTVGNKIINFLSNVLGSYSEKSGINSLITEIRPLEINLTEKIIGNDRIIKINEIIKHKINPLGIAFEINIDEKSFFISHFYSDKSIQLVSSVLKYETTLPFDLLINEYKELDGAKQIMKDMINMEL